MTSSQLREDRALARRVATGDHGAFEEFFREYFPRLYGFTLIRVNNDEGLAEEIVQRTMCIVVRKMGSYRGEALLFTWLCQICRNERSAIFRRQGIDAARRVMLEDNVAIQASLESLSVDFDESQSAQRAQELARFVRVTLEYLPTKYSKALEMKYLNGNSVNEIGEYFNISSKAAESVLSRARAAFKEGFRSLWDFEPEFLLD
jgi:RNA polymerase sigma-70 factor, ECF subfamily